MGREQEPGPGLGGTQLPHHDKPDLVISLSTTLMSPWAWVPKVHGVRHQGDTLEPSTLLGSLHITYQYVGQISGITQKLSAPNSFWSWQIRNDDSFWIKCIFLKGNSFLSWMESRSHLRMEPICQCSWRPGRWSSFQGQRRMVWGPVSPTSCPLTEQLPSFRWWGWCQKENDLELDTWVSSSWSAQMEPSQKKKNCNYSTGPVPCIESILFYSSHTKREALSHLKRCPTAPLSTEGSVKAPFSIQLTSRGGRGPLASGLQPWTAPEWDVAVILAASFKLHLWSWYSQLAFSEEPPPAPKLADQAAGLQGLSSQALSKGPEEAASADVSRASEQRGLCELPQQHLWVQSRVWLECL